MDRWINFVGYAKSFLTKSETALQNWSKVSFSARFDNRDTSAVPSGKAIAPVRAERFVRIDHLCGPAGAGAYRFEILRLPLPDVDSVQGRSVGIPGVVKVEVTNDPLEVELDGQPIDVWITTALTKAPTPAI
jgi:hypothetical protein